MITAIELINWRAFEQRRIRLEPGITFLMGANGAGKTSVLEAISYGLTGEGALFSSKTRPRLLRDPDQNATVNLEFELQGQSYQVSRSQGPRAAAGAELKRLADGKVLASTHAAVTRYLARAMGVSSDFLRRIMYMAEGDVYSFINNPPAEALENQVRQVLGLTQLDTFAQALVKAEKQLKQRLEALQELVADLTRLEIRTEAGLQERLRSGQMVRDLLLRQIEENKARAILIQNQSEEALRVQDLAAVVAEQVSRAPALWQGFHTTPLIEYVAHLEAELEQGQQAGQAALAQVARLEGEQQAYAKILAVLAPYQDSTETQPCPVCQKPLSVAERDTVLDHLRAEMQAAQEQAAALRAHSAQAEAQHRAAKARLELLRQLRALVGYGRISGMGLDCSFDQINAALAESLETSRQLAGLDTERAEIQARMNQLQSQQAAFLAIQKRLQDLSFTRPEDVSTALVGLEVRLLSLRSAVQACQQTLISQRDSDLAFIYNQIAQLWGAFTGQPDWQMALDQQGVPTLQDDLGRPFDLFQLSGGEKTALLILLHTLIAHNFSSIDFLMIDEPLEHLDPVNRRSLVRFLVQSHRKSMFKQAIVATFEESLVRKYLSEDGVHVVMI